MSWNVDDSYFCTNCGASFPSKEHQCSVGSGPIKDLGTHYCAWCNAWFETSSERIRHDCGAKNIRSSNDRFWAREKRLRYCEPCDEWDKVSIANHMCPKPSKMEILDEDDDSKLESPPVEERREPSKMEIDEETPQEIRHETPQETRPQREYTPTPTPTSRQYNRIRGYRPTQNVHLFAPRKIE